MNSLITTSLSDYVHIGSHTNVYADDILYCEGDRNYSQVHFMSRRKVTVATHLAILEARLARRGFVRVSRSALVNASYILDYDDYEVMLTNGRMLPIARRRRVAVRRWLNGRRCGEGDVAQTA